MSRFSEGDWDNPISYAWEGRINSILRSKAGQKKLHEMVEALMALPRHRLIEGAICEDGDVCAVGAYALHKGKLDPSVDFDGDSSDTAELGRSCGLGFMLGWQFGWLNDEQFGSAHNGCYGKPIRDDKGRVWYLYRKEFLAEIPDDLGRLRLQYVRDPVGQMRLANREFTPEERWQAVHKWVSAKLKWNYPVPV